jgi:hypothetical protein
VPHSLLFVVLLSPGSESIQRLCSFFAIASRRAAGNSSLHTSTATSTAACACCSSSGTASTDGCGDGVFKRTRSVKALTSKRSASGGAAISARALIGKGCVGDSAAVLRLSCKPSTCRFSCSSSACNNMEGWQGGECRRGAAAGAAADHRKRCWAGWNCRQHQIARSRLEQLQALDLRWWSHQRCSTLRAGIGDLWNGRMRRKERAMAKSRKVDTAHSAAAAASPSYTCFCLHLTIRMA